VCSGAPTAAPSSLKNLVGRLTLVTTSDGNSTKYTSYDALGRVLTSSQAIAGVAGSYDFVYTYNHLGLAVRYPSGTTTSYSYDAAGRVKQADWGTGKTAGVNGTPKQNRLAVKIEAGERKYGNAVNH
jgi:YD repeat-containing protein